MLQVANISNLTGSLSADQHIATSANCFLTFAPPFGEAYVGVA